MSVAPTVYEGQERRALPRRAMLRRTSDALSARTSRSQVLAFERARDEIITLLARIDIRTKAILKTLKG